MSTTEQEVTTTDMVEVQRALPTQMSRFEAFLMEAPEKLALAKKELETAQEFAVDSEVAFQVSDQLQVTLRGGAKTYEQERLKLTRPIDDFKQQFVDAEKAVSGTKIQAATVYQQKMSGYRRAEKLKAEEAQRAAEKLLREERERKEAEARKLEAKAATLKTQAAQEKATQQAAEIRQVASLMPETVALSAPAPQTVASNIAELWEVESVENVSIFLRWLADHPEWLGVVRFQTGEMNRMAKQFRNVVPVPGVRFHSKDSFRTKAR